MRHSIFFEDRELIICDHNDSALNIYGAVIEFVDDEEVLCKLPLRFLDHKEITTLVLPCDDPQERYEQFCTYFVHKVAAGGVVTNSEGEYLMIKRFGHWDLPKGHREEGEDVETTALREVTEETGIKNQVILSFITVTNHTYFLNGDFCLKSVYWYKMEYDGNILLKPQREEDIVDARWISGEELHSCLESAYGSTKQVFEALLFS